MLNKKGEGAETSTEYTTGLVLMLLSVIFIILLLTSCTKALNPNCDPNSVQVFNEFVEYYKGCAGKTGDCGNFIYSKIDKLDNIVVNPNGNKLDSTAIQLKCNGKNSFRYNKKISVGLCFKDGESIKPADTESSVNIYSDEENDFEYFLNNHLNLFNVGSDRICFVLIGKTMKEYTEEETRKQFGSRNYNPIQ